MKDKKEFFEVLGELLRNAFDEQKKGFIDVQLKQTREKIILSIKNQILMILNLVNFSQFYMREKVRVDQ